MDADHQKKPPRLAPKDSANHRPENDQPENNAPLPNSAVDDFFIKMNHDFRRPKPSEEAVAAALHAIQTLTDDTAEDQSEAAAPESALAADSPQDAGEPCPKCHAINSRSNRFCGFCGLSLIRRHQPASSTVAQPSALTRESRGAEPPLREQHIHHHHHHYFPDSVSKPSFGESSPALTGELATPRPTPAAVEASIQNLVRDWSLCCNSKRLDDLLALYSSDAIVLRPNLSPAHGRPAIRLLLQSALQSGLGDVEFEPADVGVLGDIACLTGRSRMLVPTAPGQRHEEAGKFLIVARRENGEWKILADSWCIDVFMKPVAPPTTPVVAPRAPRK